MGIGDNDLGAHREGDEPDDQHLLTVRGQPAHGQLAVLGHEPGVDLVRPRAEEQVPHADEHRERGQPRGQPRRVLRVRGDGAPGGEHALPQADNEEQAAALDLVLDVEAHLGEVPVAAPGHGVPAPHADDVDHHGSQPPEQTVLRLGQGPQAPGHRGDDGPDDHRDAVAAQRGVDVVGAGHGAAAHLDEHQGNHEGPRGVLEGAADRGVHHQSPGHDRQHDPADLVLAGQDHGGLVGGEGPDDEHGQGHDEGLARPAPRLVLQEVLGELGDREDPHQVEEELEEGHRLVGGGRQRGGRGGRGAGRRRAAGGPGVVVLTAGLAQGGAPLPSDSRRTLRGADPRHSNRGGPRAQHDGRRRG